LYQKLFSWTIHVQVIVKDVVTCFFSETQCIYLAWSSLHHLYVQHVQITAICS